MQIDTSAYIYIKTIYTKRIHTYIRIIHSYKLTYTHKYKHMIEMNSRRRKYTAKTLKNELKAKIFVLSGE